MRPFLSVGLATLGVALIASACGGSGAPPSPTSPAETPTPAREATPPPRAADQPVRHVVPDGGQLPSEHGRLYVDLSTGEQVFWVLPNAGAPRPISRDGRWVVWGPGDAPARNLLDTRKGVNRQLLVGNEAVTRAWFSEDGRYLVADTGSVVALLETESGKVLAQAPRPAQDAHGSAEFTTRGAAAIGFRAGGTFATLILRPDGTTSVIDGATGQVRWSPDGSRLAVRTATGTRIVSADGSTKLELASGGPDATYNPRWSPDGRYLGLATYDAGGRRIYDAASGQEVLRTTGTLTCLGSFWLDDGTLEFGSKGDRVVVPTGEIRSGQPREEKAGYRLDDTAPAGIVRLLLDSGGEAEVQSMPSWSFYYDSEALYRATTDGHALFLVGVGGKGLCDYGPSEPPAVQLPPFAD
jgi:dipeptidyl aminopeptidase/acylaminoacyl peptidase